MPVNELRNYINGQWVEVPGGVAINVENPSTGQTIATVPLSTAAQTGQAVEAAHAAFASWRDVPVARRVQPLFELLTRLRADEENLARILTREMGKSLPDARAELKRTFENIEVACGMPVLQQGDGLVGAAADVDGEVLRLPMGVFGLIAPFNFPAMVPFWFIPYAIAAGNTYVAKPSEQVPCTMQRIAEHMDQVGLPPGVFNLVNGDKTVAEALMDHPLVQGISMVGSTATCARVAERCARANKRFQAMGSAKNHLVVMPDAPVTDVVRNMISSCYGCAGQRCMAASAIVCVGEETGRAVEDEFLRASAQVIVADPLDPAVAGEPMVMGPVISARAKEFILGMIDTGIAEGATLALDGRGLTVEGCEGGHFIGPTVFRNVSPGMAIHTTEIFGPVVVMLQVDTLDQAISITNAHPYGNGASLYTRSGYWSRRFKLEVNAGMIGINVGIPAPVAHLPFGGAKASQWADIKAQGRAVVSFFTQDKIVTERYWPEA